MGSPEVRLFADDQLIHAVAFEGERMRIGRRPENDLVIEDLAVSRMHAVLVREPDGSIVLEDAGSGNGSYLDGERIEGRAALPPGRPVRMGRHVVVWVEVDAAASSAADALANEPVEAVANEPAEAVANEPVEASQAEADLPVASSSPAPGEVSLFDFALEEDLEPGAGLADEGISLDDLSGSEDLASLEDGSGVSDRREPDGVSDFSGAADLDDLSDLEEVASIDDQPALPDSEAEPESDPLVAPEAPTSDPLGAPASDPLVAPGSDPLVAPGSDPLIAPAAPAQYAGLVVQHSGALLRVVAWEADRMCIGRGDDCEVLLESTGVSRRHALLVRDGAAYEVRDLESINGTEVNGEKVRRRVLEAGDVVRIENFEITFLLDHSPIADEVQVEKAESRVARGDAEGPLDLTLIREFSDVEETGLPTLELDSPPEPTAELDADVPLPAEPDMPASEMEPAEADLFADDEEVPLVEDSLDGDAIDPLLVETEPREERGDATMLAPELLFDASEPALSAPLQDEELPRLSVLDQAADEAESDEEKDTDEPVMALGVQEPVAALPPAVAADALPVGVGAIAKLEDVPPPLVSLNAADPMGKNEQAVETAASVSGTATIGGLVFDLRLSQAELPEALAEALQNSEGGELRIPVELCIRRD